MSEIVKRAVGLVAVVCLILFWVAAGIVGTFIVAEWLWNLAGFANPWTVGGTFAAAVGGLIALALFGQLEQRR